MEWPQITLIALLTAEFCIVASKHGTPRPDFNAWLRGADTLFLVWLLHKGGFWS